MERERVRLRIGNMGNAVLITGQVYQDPKDALNEFVSNAADEYAQSGRLVDQLLVLREDCRQERKVEACFVSTRQPSLMSTASATRRARILLPQTLVWHQVRVPLRVSTSIGRSAAYSPRKKGAAR